MSFPRTRSTVPAYHTRPTVRMNKPISLTKPDKHPTSSLRNYRFRSYTPREIRLCHDLVYDPNANMKMSGPRFSGDFECGNLGQVYRIGPRSYEIRMLPDPTNYYSALWFFFKVENLKPGEYFFVINGFFRDCHQHNIGVQPVAYSERLARKGVGWQRIGYNLNFWTTKHSLTPEFALSFNFTVMQSDTMYFALLYPYTFTDLKSYLLCSQNTPFLKYSTLCKSPGGLDVPAIFWDADDHKCVDVNYIPMRKGKPVLVIAARLHPGESNSSFAMEGFMSFLQGGSPEANQMLDDYSLLLLPMVNPDGVVCGYYRPALNGEDVNRVWKGPNQKTQTVAFNVIRILDQVSKYRQILFLLDFHGHTAQSNCFTYGVMHPAVKMNEYERLFPETMAQCCHLFDEVNSISMNPREFSQTMRVALHHRYQIPFAYTLEMSFGAIEIGPESSNQMTPHHYRYIGECTGVGIVKMLARCNGPMKHLKNSLPPLFKTDNA